MREETQRRRLVVFLDYDGTLTPIVSDPAAATLSPEMRAAVRKLATKSTVAVVSGRAREKVREFVDINELYYAGSHGFDIDGPGGLRHAVSGEILPLLQDARHLLEQRLAAISGASLEDNRFSVSVHWRNVADELSRQTVETIVDDVLASPPFSEALRKSRGRCVYELRPNVKWDKGAAVLYLLELLRVHERPAGGGGSNEAKEAEESKTWYSEILPIYIGDDMTDEDAFAALRPLGGLAVLVMSADAERPRSTSATHTLQGVDEVHCFINELASHELAMH